MAYTKTVWQNTPSTASQLSSANLNNMENGIEDVDTRLTSVESNKKYCKMKPSASFNITNGIDTIALLDTVVYNEGLTADTVNNRITIPTGEAGIYMINGQAYFSANSSGRRFCNILKNGSVQIALQNVDKTTASTTYIQNTTVAELAENDYIQLQMYQDSGSTLTGEPLFIYLTVTKLY